MIEYIQNPAFSNFVNGKAFGFFNSCKGPRQGCPLSSHLFCNAMEFFSAVLSECAKNGLIPMPYQIGTYMISHLLENLGGEH